MNQGAAMEKETKEKETKIAMEIRKFRQWMFFRQWKFLLEEKKERRKAFKKKKRAEEADEKEEWYKVRYQTKRGGIHQAIQGIIKSETKIKTMEKETKAATVARLEGIEAYEAFVKLRRLQCLALKLQTI